MILHTCEGSRGLRVSWTAVEAGIELDYRMMAFPPRKFSPEYLLLNPLGTVPMLQDGDVELTESTAICHYIVARNGDRSLLVDHSEHDYGLFLDFLHHADTTLTFPQTVFLRFSILERARGLADAGEAYGRWFAARLARIEFRLTDRLFLCAERFTIADIAVCYALWLAGQTGLDRHFGPNVARYFSIQSARTGFQEALRLESEQASGLRPSLLSILREGSGQGRHTP